MWNGIFEYITANYPIAIILILLVWATWKIRGLFESSKKISDKVNSLPCEGHKNELSSIKQNSAKLDDISASIRKIEEWILRTDIDAMKDLVRKCSPLQLTEIGQILLSETKAKETVEENLEHLLFELEKTAPKTAYDVEKNSLSVLTGLVDNEMFNYIKNFIYHSPQTLEVETSEGKKSVPIDMNRILMIMSIYLRNMYFDRHKELNVSDFGLATR